MCYRIAASILKGASPTNVTGDKAAEEQVVGNDEEYKACVMELDSVVRYHTNETRKMRECRRRRELQTYRAADYTVQAAMDKCVV